MEKPTDPIDKTSKEEIKENANTAAKWSGLTFQMMAAIGLGLWAGMWLDKKLDLSFPAFTLGLTLLGLIGSLYLVIREATKG